MKPITNNFLFLSVFSLQNYLIPFCLVFFLYYSFNIFGFHCRRGAIAGWGVARILLPLKSIEVVYLAESLHLTRVPFTMYSPFCYPWGVLITRITIVS